MKRALILLALTFPLFAPPAKARTGGQLDQVALMHKFVGLWQRQSQDTTFHLDWRSFGDTAFVVAWWSTLASGERLDEQQRVYGYDVKSGKYIAAVIRKGAGRASFSTLWFTSDHRCELVGHPDPMNLSGSIGTKSVVEFRTPDEWSQTTAYPDGRPQNTVTLRRVRQ